MNRFRVTKIGLLNFWLYDEEEYDFYGGKLILRGTNGSGKSITMQSFIPLILDGNKSPDRLDPFGSKDRKIEDYILGYSESVQKEEAISYLYMETYNEDENRYITVGLGFRGRKGKSVESWGFALKDGKRILKDFYLYKDPVNKIPLTKNELKSRLGDINEFVDSTKDYKAMVNRLLFGFPNLDLYDEFIKLLLQLRSNKLSKDYKPTNLVNVLNSVLQPLSEEDLRPLSEAVEQMNKTKEKVETLEKNYKSLNDFLRVYRNYNEIVLLTKARNYKEKNNSYKQQFNKSNELDLEIKENQSLLDSSKVRQKEVYDEIEVNEENRRQLDNQDLKDKVASLSKIEEDIKFLSEKISKLEESIEKEENSKFDLSKKISELDESIYIINREIKELVSELKDTQEDSYFDEIVFFADEFLDNMDEEFSFDGIFTALRSYSDRINAVIVLLQKEQEILLRSESVRLEFEKLVREYSELEKEVNNEENKRIENISQWEEKFINILNNNRFLKLADAEKKEVLKSIRDYSTKNYSKIKDLYSMTARSLINKVTSDNLVLQSKKDRKLEEVSSLEIQYEELKNSDTLELPSINVESDKVLLENNIEFIPLYKCIEFKDSVSDEVKNSLEAALFDLNLLNAKVISEKDIDKVSKLGVQVLYLKKTTKKKDNLLKYFDVNLEKSISISESYVKEILESISVSKEDALYILESGEASVDVIKTFADKNYKQAYIGYLKRLELKNLKLKELEEKINAVNAEISNLDNLIKEGYEKVSVLEHEETLLPSNEEIEFVCDTIKNLRVKITYNDDRQKELEESLAKFDRELKEVKSSIIESNRGLHVPLNLDAFRNVSIRVTAIKELLQNLKSMHNTYVNSLVMNSNYKERLDEILERIDDLHADKDEKERQLKVNSASRDKIKELLETKEYKDLSNRLMEIENNLIRLSKEKDELIKNISVYSERIDIKSRSKEECDKELERLTKIKDIYLDVFLREYKLHYVYNEDVSDIDNFVKNIIKDGSVRKDVTLNEALSNFWSSYNHYSLELNDYSIRDFTLFNDYEGEDEEVKKIYIDNARPDISAMYQGVKINIIELALKLRSDIDNNKELINEEDRHLFEDILLNTVGGKIRDRIEESKNWVDKINNIMSDMQKNSALSFKLVWKSVNAEDEGELDTREIVRILKLEPWALKPSDKSSLTNHFRSKLKKAEEIYKESFVSFYKIVDDILDYRNWFTFQLMYQRKGDSLRELTDKTFSKFSGGERAKSMYIPLFASVSAKFNLAREDSLRVIALDEAFAGVDEDNIREMFGIMNHLELDFIINSQVLWGDYDTIEDLSICELIRPQNSQVVTVERYRWNGKYKELINNRKEYNEELMNEGVH